MDYAQLRNLLEPLVTGLKDAGTHTMLPTLCEELGLPAPGADGSKRERMTASFNSLADTDLPAVARFGRRSAPRVMRCPMLPRVAAWSTAARSPTPWVGATMRRQRQPAWRSTRG